MTKSQQQEWELLDSQRVIAMLQAEQHCRKLKLGSVAWSPQIQAAIEAVLYWQLRRKRLLGGKVASKRLARLQRAISMDRRVGTLEQVEAALKDARMHYRELKSRAAELRLTWLEGLAYARSMVAGGSPSSHLQELRQREQSRRDSRITKLALGQSRVMPVITVQTTQADGTIIDCETQEAIEQACIRENVSRFQQAHATPFLNPHLING